MAVQVTAATEEAGAFILQQSVIGLGYNIQIKVYQVGVVGTVSLGMTDTMRVMTGGAFHFTIE